MRLSGTERISVEVTGRVRLVAERRSGIQLPAPFRFDPDDQGRVEIGLLFLEMRGLGAVRIPGPRFDYKEALFRLGLLAYGKPAWLAVRCDLDSAPVRVMAAALIRYPVQSAHIFLEDAKGALACETLTTEDAVSLRVRLDESLPVPAVIPPRRTFVFTKRGRALEIPWDERPAPERRAGHVEVSSVSACVKAFGAEPEWDPIAHVHRGRIHLCGTAQRVRD